MSAGTWPSTPATTASLPRTYWPLTHFVAATPPIWPVLARPGRGSHPEVARSDSKPVTFAALTRWHVPCSTPAREGLAEPSCPRSTGDPGCRGRGGLRLLSPRGRHAHREGPGGGARRLGRSARGPGLAARP